MKTEETLSLLSKADIFSTLPRKDLLRLAGLVKKRDYSKGESVIHQGDFGDSIYFICRGRVEVSIRNQERAENIISSLGEGDFFGEMALLTGSPRTATVKVVEDALLLFLYKKDFDKLIHDHPYLGIFFTRILAERLGAMTRLYSDQVDKDEQLKRLITREEDQHLTHLVGKTKRYLAIEERIRELSASEEPLIIAGPEGTATEDVARLVHLKGPRQDRPFMIIDLGGGDEWRGYLGRIRSSSRGPVDEDQLFEDFQISTLFGHEPDSLAGADASRLGYMELADGGVLVLKNIDRIAPGTRERLLFYILEKKIYRLGAIESKNVDTMIMLTLHHHEDGDDLDKRLKGKIPYPIWENRIDVPSLYARRRDIPLIAQSYLEKHAADAGKSINRISPQAINTLVRYSWPGNDQELESVIERGVMVCDGDALLAEHIFLGLKPYSETGRPNLLRGRLFRLAFADKNLRLITEAAFVVVMLAIMVLAFFGTQDPGGNIGGSLVWYYWWPYLLLSFIIFGRIYCSVCPVHGMARYFRKLGSFDFKAPKIFKHIGITTAAVAGIGLFWIETAFDLRNVPLRTAYLLAIIVLSAILFNFIYRPEVWCRYLCPLGYFSGVYSCLAPMELRANNNVCSSQCKTTDCYKEGNQDESCPMNLFPVSLMSNQFCKMCGTCVRNCRYNSIHLDLRWPGAELWKNREPNLITSLSIPALLGMVFALFLREYKGVTAGGWLNFTILFWASCLGAIAVFLGLTAAGGGGRLREKVSLLGFVYLPLAFSGHLSFQLPAMARSLKIVGIGGNIAAGEISTYPGLQVTILSIGLAWSLWTLWKISRHLERLTLYIHGACLLLACMILSVILL